MPFTVFRCFPWFLESPIVTLQQGRHQLLYRNDIFNFWSNYTDIVRRQTAAVSTQSAKKFKMEGYSIAGQARLPRVHHYIYGYGISDGRVVYMKKDMNRGWEDSWYRDGDDIVFKYQNCYGPPWENKVKPALNNTPDDSVMILQAFPPDHYFYVKKRHISQHGKGESTFTVLARVK